MVLYKEPAGIPEYDHDQNVHFWREKIALLSFCRLLYRKFGFIVYFFDLSILNTSKIQKSQINWLNYKQKTTGNFNQTLV